MNRLKLAPIENGKVTITVEDGAQGEIVLKLAGSIDHPAPGSFLDPYFVSLHGAALEGNVRAVHVDFTQLSFLNSSGIKALIKWVMTCASLEASSRYAIKLLYSSKVTWQQTSLRAITVLTKGFVVTEGV